MKIIHGSLSGLLAEVKAHGPRDAVRVAALMQSTVEGAGLPRYTSWVIVSGRLGRLPCLSLKKQKQLPGLTGVSTMTFEPSV